MNESDVKRLEEARREAMLRADTAVLDELLDEEMVWVHASAKSDTKSSFLEGFADGRLQAFRLDQKENKVQILGDVALVTGVLDMEVALNGERRSQSNLYSCIWVERNSKIRMLRCQSTRIPAGA